jgi:hypothetical protein
LQDSAVVCDERVRLLTGHGAPYARHPFDLRPVDRQTGQDPAITVGHHEKVGRELLLVLLDDAARGRRIRLTHRRLQPGQIGDQARFAGEVLHLHPAVFLDQGARFGQAAHQLVFRLRRDRDVDVVDAEGDRDHREQGARHEDAVRERGEEPQAVQL